MGDCSNTTAERRHVSPLLVLHLWRVCYFRIEPGTFNLIHIYIYMRITWILDAGTVIASCIISTKKHSILVRDIGHLSTAHSALSHRSI